jgi:trigger factor
MELKKNERINGYTVELEVAVDRDEFEAGLKKAYRENVGKINVPGFRRGKAPRGIIEKMYGAQVFYEDGVNNAFPAAYEAAVKEAGIVPVDQAELDVKELSADGFTFTAKVTVRPSVDPGDYKSVRIEKHVHEVTDENVDEEIKRMAQRGSRTVTVERAAADGDTVNIDYEGFTDGVAFDGGKGEGYDLVLGSGNFIPGFEEQIVGHNAGDEFDIDITFPEEYHSEALAGASAVFKIKVNEVKETILPDIDDEFAKDVSECDTLDELKAETRVNLEKANAEHIDQAFEADLFEALAALVTDEVPEIMYEDAVSHMIDDFGYRMSMQGISIEQYLSITGGNMDTFRESFRERAEQQVKVGLVIEAVGKAEGFEASDEEIEAEYAKLATEQMPIERVKTILSEDSMRSDIITNKTLDYVKGIAAVEGEHEHHHHEEEE